VYPAGRWIADITVHDNNTVSIGATFKAKAKRTEIAAYDFDLGAEPIRIEVKAYSNGRFIFVAIIQKTHFGNTDVFVIDEQKKSVHRTVSCISALPERLNSGLIEERALAKYAFEKLPPGIEQTTTMRRIWKFDSESAEFRESKWTALADGNPKPHYPLSGVKPVAGEPAANRPHGRKGD